MCRRNDPKRLHLEKNDVRLHCVTSCTRRNTISNIQHLMNAMNAMYDGRKEYFPEYNMI